MPRAPLRRCVATWAARAGAPRGSQVARRYSGGGDRRWGCCGGGARRCCAAARLLLLGGGEVEGFRCYAPSWRIRARWGTRLARFGGEGCTPASTKAWRRSLNGAMPTSASSRACQNRHGGVSLRIGLQSKNLFATRCRRTWGTTFMYKVLAGLKVGIYKMFKILLWTEMKMGFWGFKK